VSVKSRAEGGFTLVEVMVALAVVALALPALLFTLHQQLDGTGYLRDKTHAQLVAGNKLSELRLLQQVRGGLFRGSDSGVSQMVGRDWAWELRTEDTAVQGFQRVEIRVYAGEEAEGSPLHTLVAFLADLDAPAAAEVPGAG
tara:strand:+ start:124823 stop:125248 length:426 start_codon:yes stop_codon:yes gene_type:complete